MSIDLAALTPMPWIVDVRIGMVTVFAGDPPECLRDERPRVVMRKNGTQGDSGSWSVDPRDIADAEFVALARAAFEVQMRRGWYVVPTSRGKAGVWWAVRTRDGHDMPLGYAVQHPTRGECSDPLSALVDADAWMQEQEKGVPRDGIARAVALGTLTS